MNPTSVQMRNRVFRASGVALVTVLFVMGTSGAWAQAPELAIGSGSGAPGGQVDITVSLSGGVESTATAQLDVLFDPNIVSIGDPTADCVIDDRLTEQVLTATLPGEGGGRLRLAILDLMPPVASLEDGDLATCTFGIAPEAALGIAMLTADRMQVATSMGDVLCGAGSNPIVDCSSVDGTITIELPATPTVPPTSTPTVTNTRTKTPVDTPTNTPANTPTNTPMNTPTATLRSGGGGGGSCAVVPVGDSSSSGLILLLGPALLLWSRRRRA